MQVHYGLKGLKLNNSVATIGSFDGVHAGHVVIIKRIKELAKKYNGETVIITFDPHPRKVLYPHTTGKDLKMIYTIEEKIDRLSSLGVDHLVIIPFTIEFSQISSTSFIVNILLKQLSLLCMVVGFNHYFGHNKSGDFSLLYYLSKRYKFYVEEIPEKDIHHESMSSTLVREALSHGWIKKVNSYLQSKYFFFGNIQQVKTESVIGNGQLVITGLKDRNKLLPPEGTYSVTVFVNNKQYNALLWSFYNDPEICIQINTTDKLEEGSKMRIEFSELLSDFTTMESRDEMNASIKSDFYSIC